MSSLEHEQYMGRVEIGAELADPTSASGIRDRLFGWRAPLNFTHVYEVAKDQTNMGGKIDVMILGLWKSKGLTVESVEIKISKSDFASELNAPEKSDWFWRHSDRFWLAAPAGLAGKIQHDVPAAWGVLAVAGNGCRVLRPAPLNRDREPLPWEAIAGMVRNASGAGAGALDRANRAGYDAGYKLGKEHGARASHQPSLLTEASRFAGQPDDVARWKMSFDRMQELAAAMGVDVVTPRNLSPLIRVANALAGSYPDPRQKLEWARRELTAAISDLDRLIAATTAAGLSETPPVTIPGAIHE